MYHLKNSKVSILFHKYLVNESRKMEYTVSVTHDYSIKSTCDRREWGR